MTAESDGVETLPPCCVQRLRRLDEICRQRARLAPTDDLGALLSVHPQTEMLARCGRQMRANPKRLLQAFNDVLEQHTSITRAGLEAARRRFATTFYRATDPLDPLVGPIPGEFDA